LKPLLKVGRTWGDVEEPWLAVEIIHWLELRRYEILTANDESTITSLYCEIFVHDPIGEPLKLSSKIRELYLNSPVLLMDERAEVVPEGLLARDQ